MTDAIRVKEAFTLMEILIVTLIISIVLGLVSFNFNMQSDKKYKVNIENIKEFMLNNFEFENELSLKCIENDQINCFVFIDKDLNKNIKIDNLFLEVPEVYNYDKDLSKASFSKVEINDIDYEPFFELTFNSDKKHKSIVIDTLDSNVYLINSIWKKVQKFDNTNAIIDRFFENEIEVKDAL